MNGITINFTEIWHNHTKSLSFSGSVSDLFYDVISFMNVILIPSPVAVAVAAVAAAAFVIVIVAVLLLLLLLRLVFFSGEHENFNQNKRTVNII